MFGGFYFWNLPLHRGRIYNLDWKLSGSENLFKFISYIIVPCVLHINQRNGVTEKPGSAGAGEVGECPGSRRKYWREKLFSSPRHGGEPEIDNLMKGF